VAAFRREALRPLRPLAVAAGLLLLLEAGWFDWWGGWSYGSRRLTALTPALTLLLIPLGPWLAAARWRRVLLVLAAAWAVTLQGLGDLAYDLGGWNARQAWRIAAPSGEVALLVDPAEANAAVARGGKVQQVLYLDVDAPAHRARLWAVAEGQVAFTFRHFQALARSRRAGAAAWVAAFAPPPAPHSATAAPP
jgi:hypothetical protein